MIRRACPAPMSSNGEVGGGPNVMIGHLKATAHVNSALPPGIGDGQVAVEDTTAGVGGQVAVLPEHKNGMGADVAYYSPIKSNFSTTPTFSNFGTSGTALQTNGVLTRGLDLGISVS